MQAGNNGSVEPADVHEGGHAREPVAIEFVQLRVPPSIDGKGRPGLS